jgi:hypothetical protein
MYFSSCSILPQVKNENIVSIYPTSKAQKETSTLLTDTAELSTPTMAPIISPTSTITQLPNTTYIYKECNPEFNVTPQKGDINSYRGYWYLNSVESPIFEENRGHIYGYSQHIILEYKYLFINIELIDQFEFELDYVCEDYSSNNIWFHVRDIIYSPKIDTKITISSDNCKSETISEYIFVLANIGKRQKLPPGEYPLDKNNIIYAWKIDTTKERFIEIPKDDIVCTYTKGGE